MNGTEHIDELIEEMKEYNDMLDNNKNLDKEKTKQNLLEYEEKVDDDLEKTKVIDGNISEDKIDMNKVNNKDKEEDKKLNKTIIIVTGIILGLVVILLLFLIILSKYRSKTVSLSDEDIISKNQYISIIKEYGDATTDTVKEYMKAYSGKVPSFDEIKNDITSKYKVTCIKSIVNYDGSVYLDDCLIDGYTNKFKYTYGTLIEKKQEESNNKQIYIYKNNNKEDSNYYALNNKINLDNIKLIDTYTCINDDCRGYNTSTKNNKDVIILDDKYYLYNPITKDKNELVGLDTIKYMHIDLITRSDGSSYALYLTKDDGTGAFYRVDKNTIITDFKYSGNTTSEKLLESGYFAGQIDSKSNGGVSIIHQNTGEEVYYFIGAIYISDQIINNKNYYYLGYSLFGERMGCFLTNTFTKIVPDKDYYSYSLNSNGTLTINNDSSFITYDMDGNKIYESSIYTKIIKVVKDYVIVSTQKEVNILDSKGKFIIKFFDSKSSYEYHTSLTNPDITNNTINIVILDKAVNEGVEGRGLEYTYNTDTNEIKVKKLTTIGGHD